MTNNLITRTSYVTTTDRIRVRPTSVPIYDYDHPEVASYTYAISNTTFNTIKAGFSPPATLCVALRAGNQNLVVSTYSQASLASSYATTMHTSRNYYGYRYYSTEMGRWISRDPMEEDGGINFYAFVKNNSIDVIDNLGLYFVGPFPDPPPASDPCEKCPDTGKIRAGGSCGTEYRTKQQNGVPSGNGCGSKDGKKFPEGSPLWDFAPACDSHDMCYGTCGSGKFSCDKKILEDMHSVCFAYKFIPILFGLCTAQADAYVAGIIIGGNDAYEKGQDEFCRWKTCCSIYY